MGLLWLLIILKMALLLSYIMIIKVIISHRVTKINPIVFYIEQELRLLDSFNILKSNTLGTVFLQKILTQGKISSALFLLRMKDQYFIFSQEISCKDIEPRDMIES